MSARCYRALLAVLPRRFRSEYGELMVEAFRSMSHDRTGSLLAFWLFAVRDLGTAAAREWRTEMGSLEWSVLGLLRRLAGFALVAGAVGWAVTFIGPQWGIEDLGWGLTGFGYRPWWIITSSLLFAAGFAEWTRREWRSSSPLRRLGQLMLVATALLMAAQAPVPMGGVSFDSSGQSSSQGVAVHLLPVAIALLVVEWGSRGARSRRGLRAAAGLLPGLAAAALALALIFTGAVVARMPWFDTWDFVFRYAFIFPTLWLALRAGYRMLGGPGIEVRLVRPNGARAPA